MIFYGEPNQLVQEFDKGDLKYKPLFRFNKQGMYETENPKLIKRLVSKFPTNKEPKEVVEEPEEVIEVIEIEEPKEEPKEELKEISIQDRINIKAIMDMPKKELKKKLEEEFETNEYQVTENDIKKLYTCKHCLRKFDNAGVWLSHIRKFHGKTNIGGKE